MRPQGWKALPARDRRALLAGSALILAGLILTRGLPAALRAHERLRARAEAGVRELASAREALAEEPGVRDSLGARATRLVAWAPRLVGGATPAEGTAELTSLVTGLAAQHRVRVARLQGLPDSAAGLFVRVGIRLEAQGDVAGLAGWLAALEKGPKLLAVRELAVSALEPAAPPTQAEGLRAELSLIGWAAPRDSTGRK